MRLSSPRAEADNYAVKILFVAGRFPYPPLTGDTARAYHQLRILSRRHRITLLAFTRQRLSSAVRDHVAPFCERIVPVALSPVRMAASAIGGLFTEQPIQAAIFESDAMRGAVTDALSTGTFDLVHLQLARMASYINHDYGPPHVIDLVDALSLNMRRRYMTDRGPGRWAAYLEWKRLARHERAICATVDHALVVSPSDRAAIGTFDNIRINTNGVDLDEFPFSSGPRPAASIVFSGNLGYFANVRAASWFAREVLPLIRRAVPDATVDFVGARPHRELKALTRSQPGVRLVGYVDRIQPHLAQHRVAVAPMRAGSGQLLKVLEAMASGTPVVATPIALNGIAALNGEHALAAEGPQAFARHVVRVLQDPEEARRLATNARQLVEDRYTWDHSVAELERLYVESVVRTSPVRRAAGGAA